MHDAYLWVKFLHEFGTVLFVGWMLLAPAWLLQSLNMASVEAMATLRKRMTTLTVVAVGGAAVLLWGTGVAMARTLSPDAFDLHWLRTGTITALVAAVLWLACLLPWYRRMVAARLAGSMPKPGALLGWRVVAIAAAALALATLWYMVVRPI